MFRQKNSLQNTAESLGAEGSAFLHSLYGRRQHLCHRRWSCFGKEAWVLISGPVSEDLRLFGAGVAQCQARKPHVFGVLPGKEMHGRRRGAGQGASGLSCRSPFLIPLAARELLSGQVPFQVGFGFCNFSVLNNLGNEEGTKRETEVLKGPATGRKAEVQLHAEPGGQLRSRGGSRSVFP